MKLSLTRRPSLRGEQVNASLCSRTSLLGSDRLNERRAARSQQLRMNHCGGPSGGWKSELCSRQPQNEEGDAALLWLLRRTTADVLGAAALQ